MDKAGRFRHEKTIKRPTFAAGALHQEESKAVSMVFADSLSAYPGAAKRASWPVEDRG